MKTHDLGNGFYFNEHEDGSATLRNCDKGLRIDLGAEEIARLRVLIRSGKADAIRDGREPS